jgi:hypothetical protein
MLPKVPERVPRVSKRGVQALGVGRAQPVCLVTETFAVRRPACVTLFVEPAKDEQLSRQNGGESRGENVSKKAAGVIKSTSGNIANRLRSTEAILDRESALGMMITDHSRVSAHAYYDNQPERASLGRHGQLCTASVVFDEFGLLDIWSALRATRKQLSGDGGISQRSRHRAGIPGLCLIATNASRTSISNVRVDIARIICVQFVSVRLHEIQESLKLQKRDFQRSR